MSKIIAILFFIITNIPYGQIPNTLSPIDKIYGLSKFWQEVNYNFVYINRVDRVKWDSTYRQLLSTVQKTENDYQYYRELQKYCALLRDGHTNIYMPKTIEEMTTDFGEYKLFINNIEGKAIVVRINYSKKNVVPIGSEIIEINGKPTKEYIKEKVAPYLSSSTGYVLEDMCVGLLLKGLENDSFHIKIKKPSGDIFMLKLVHGKTTEETFYPPLEKVEIFNFKWYEGKIAYIGLNSFVDPKIDSLFYQKIPELRKAKGLIIDLRKNGGGSTNIGTDIFQYLTNDNVIYGSKSRSRQHIPSYKAWGKFVSPADTIESEWARKSFLSSLDNYYYDFPYNPDTIKLDINRLVVPTAILIGHNTGSAAEDFLIYTENQKHIIKIGENSFGSTGQPYIFDLVGGGSARVCTKMDTYPSGKEFVGYGVKPEIEVKLTLKDFMQQKDPVLDKALEYLKEKLK